MSACKNTRHSATVPLVPFPFRPVPSSPTRSISPVSGWTVVPRPGGTSQALSASPLGSGHGSKGGKRRFFGLSETAEAEAKAAAESAKLGDRGVGCDGRGKVGVEAETHALSGGEKYEVLGKGKEFIHAHRMVVSLRSDPMRAMLRSGEALGAVAVFRPFYFLSVHTCYNTLCFAECLKSNRFKQKV